VRGGHEGVGAAVQVQERSLRALEDNPLARAQAVLDETVPVGGVAADFLGGRPHLLKYLVNRQRRLAVLVLDDDVLVLELPGDQLPKPVGISQVPEAHRAGHTGGLVGVGRADAAQGRANPAATARLLGQLLDALVIGHNYVGSVADAQIVAGNSAGLQALYLIAQDERINDSPAGHKTGTIGVQNPGGNQVQLKLFSTDDNGMPGVATALIADDKVSLFGENIGDLALAFVTPLAADNNGAGHAHRSLLTKNGPGVAPMDLIGLQNLTVPNF